MPKRRSSSRKRSRSRSRSPKNRRKSRSKSRRSKSRSRKGSKVLKYLGTQQMDVSPFVTPKSGVRDLSSGLFTSDYKPLFSDRSKYVDKGKYNPFSPDAKKDDVFQHLTSNNEYMRRLLDLHREGQDIGVSLNVGGVGSSGEPISVYDKHPNSIIPEKEPKVKQEGAGGGGHPLLNRLIGGGLSIRGTAFSPHRLGSTMGLKQIRVVPPKTPQYIRNRIKDVDQMILKADINTKETAKKLRGSNYMVVSNPDSFDPDKEYLFNYKKF